MCVILFAKELIKFETYFVALGEYLKAPLPGNICSKKIFLVHMDSLELNFTANY